MRAGDFWVVRTAVAYGLRGGAMRARASSFSAVLGQSRSLRHPRSRAGGELDIGSHAGARPEPKYAFVSHAVSDVMQKARPYQGRVHRARIEPHARKANGACFRADDRVAL